MSATIRLSQRCVRIIGPKCWKNLLLSLRSHGYCINRKCKGGCISSSRIIFTSAHGVCSSVRDHTYRAIKEHTPTTSISFLQQKDHVLLTEKFHESIATGNAPGHMKEKLLTNFQETRTKVKEKVDEIIEKENIWTIPNLLCVSRIFISPALAYFVLTSSYSTALGLFIFAGCTDLVDGWIARSFPGQASRLGSFLDPLADKILVAILFLSLTYAGSIPVILTGLIIYRDVVIIAGASYVRYKSIPPPKTLFKYFDASYATAQLAPTTISKINTAIQLLLITTSLAAPVFAIDHHFFPYLWWITAGTTIGSGISYIFSSNTYKILRQENDSLSKPL